MAIDVGTPEGQVRLLIADMDESNPILSDDAIKGFLAIEGDTIKLAAAAALEAIASGESLLSKKLRTLTTSTDGPAVAADLRKHAAALRAQVAAAADAEEGSFFEVIPFAPYRGIEGTERGVW